MGIMTDTFSMGPLPVHVIFRPACTMSQVTVQIYRHSDCYGQAAQKFLQHNVTVLQ